MGTDKQMAVQLHNGLLLSNKKENELLTEHWRVSKACRLKELRYERLRIICFPLYGILEKAKPQRQKTDQGVRGD